MGSADRSIAGAAGADAASIALSRLASSTAASSSAASSTVASSTVASSTVASSTVAWSTVASPAVPLSTPPTQVSWEANSEAASAVQGMNPPGAGAGNAAAQNIAESGSGSEHEVSGIVSAQELSTAVDLDSPAAPPLAIRAQSSLPLAVAASKGVAQPAPASPRATNAAAVPSLPARPSPVAPGLEAADSAGTAAGKQLTAASQNPFEVFFADPGAGPQSAVAAFPKIILPVNAASTHSGYSGTGSSGPGTLNPGFSNASGANNGLHGNAGPGAGSAGAVNKGAISVGQSAPAGLTAHKDDADPNGSNLAIDWAQNSATQSAAVAQAPPAALSTAPALAAVVPQSGAALPDPLVKSGSAPAANVPVIPLAANAEAAVLAPAPPGPVQVAQMVSRVGQAEMRIGMNTSAFGSVEVHTVVHASDVGLTIGSEKGDLRGLLNNEMPALSNVLQQQNLKLTNINFMQGFGFSNHASGGGDSQQRAFTPTPQASASFGSSDLPEDDSLEARLTQMSGAGSGLSILA